MHYTKFLLWLLISISFGNLYAQVPVIEEPHHKPVLVNDYVRLLDVHINPGDTTLYHVHAAPSVIVILSNSIVGMQKMDESPVPPNSTTAGSVSFVDYGARPITHRVFDAGNNTFHVMDIELVRKEPLPDSFIVLQQPNIQTVVNEKLVRAYKFDVGAKQSLNINRSSNAFLLVCINGEISSSDKTIKTGDYIFFNPMTEVLLANKQNTIANCVLLELK